MRHPLRAVIPASAVTTTTNQTSNSQGSQPLKHTIIQNPTCYFSAHAAEPFPFHRLQTAQCLRPEETVQSLVKGIFIRPVVSTTFRRASEQTGAPLLFGLGVPSALPSSLIRLFVYRNEAYDILSRVFAPDLSITQHKDRQMYPQSFSVNVPNFEAHGNVPFFSARFCNHQCRTSVDSDFLTGSCRVFVLGNSSRLNLGSQCGAFLPSSDNSFHTWFSKSDRSSSHCRSLAFVEVSMQAPCNAFVSFTPFAHKGRYALHLWIESRAVTIMDLHLRLASRISLSWSSRSIRCVLFCSIVHQGPCPRLCSSYLCSA